VEMIAAEGKLSQRQGLRRNAHRFAIRSNVREMKCIERNPQTKRSFRKSLQSIRHSDLRVWANDASKEFSVSALGELSSLIARRHSSDFIEFELLLWNREDFREIMIGNEDFDAVNRINCFKKQCRYGFLRV
jgi:hypothetical protein